MADPIKVPITVNTIDYVEQFKQYIIPELGECPAPLMERVIRDKTIEFCRETEVWQHEIPPLNIKQDLIDYIMVNDVGCTEISKVVDVILDELTIDPILGYSLANPDTLRLRVQPNRDIDNGLRILVALSPLRTADDDVLEERIFNDNYDHIQFGILASLYIMGNKTWTNHNLYDKYNMLYRDGIRSARIKINRRGINSSPRVRTRNFTLIDNRRQGIIGSSQQTF